MSESFGNYEILRKLAVGGMAEVFLAKHESLGGFERLLCIKRILPHLGQQADFISMFQDEARIAANLIHPNIAQIYDIGQLDQSYYIALEFVNGEDIRRVYNQEVKRGRAMPLEPAAQIIMGAAAGLAYAHKHANLDGTPMGIVHRDISPQNILVSYTGHVKIIDFGVAKAVNKIQVTRAGVIKGKYSYMSPEQASGDPIDGRTDIFALGVTLYEITTGTRLFKRNNELETLAAVIECKVTPPSQVIPDYDSTLEAIILKCLEFEPNNRYESATGLERELEKFLVARSHPTTPSILGEYMEELFADKLLDEQMLGGPMWGEEHTKNGTVSQKRTKRLTPEPEVQPSKPALTNDEKTQLAPIDNDSTEKISMENLWDKYATSLSSTNAHPENSSDSGPIQHPLPVETTELVSHDDEPTVMRESFDPSPTISTNTPPSRRTSELTNAPKRKASTYALLTFLAVVVTAGLFKFVLNQPQEENPTQGAEQSGPILIQSVPTGATARFEGENSEKLQITYGGKKTPFQIEGGLSLDNHIEIVLDYPGQEPITIPAYPLQRSPKPSVLSVTFRNAKKSDATGFLYLVTSPPGAEVKIDGKKIPGGTPLSNIEISAGQKHTLEFSHPEHETVTRTIHVTSNQKEIIEIKFSPSTGKKAKIIETSTPITKSTAVPEEGYLKVSSSFSGNVSIDGTPKGKTPISKLILPAGKHQLEFGNSTYGVTLYREVSIEPGKTSRIHFAPKKGMLSVNAQPWARIYVGKTINGTETPAQLELYEGSYSLLLVCPNGKPKRIRAVVKAGKTRAVSATCK